MIKILQIFRKKNPAFFSIEKVFGSIRLLQEKMVQLDIVSLPFYNSGLVAIFRNLNFLKRRRGATVYHVTGDVHYAVLALPAKKTILTIHDCVFLYSSTGVKRWILKRLFLDLPVKHAAAITTISEFSRGEIIRFSKCDPGKVVVIANPVNDSIFFQRKPFNAERPVILFIGVTPNKNLERVAPALEGISCRLVVLGKLNAGQEELLSRHQVDFTSVQGVSEEALAQLYADSDMVLFPSVFEGFGLPIIEGQKAGRVVITSNTEPMKSVAGGGAYLVDPYDINAIREGVQTIIKNADIRNNLIEAGLENIQKYSAIHIADAYQQLYEKVAVSNT